MLQNMMKDLALWIHGMFIQLLSYCANALLAVMNMDLSYFESNVPIVTTFYETMVAIGWGLLIGNCIFQCLKAMFAGLGFETESPWTLLLRTGLFGFLLFFSYSICDIGLSIGSKIMDLIGIPAEVEITMPTESEFSSLDVSWLLITIIGFLIGIQVFKLFFEIAERYAVVAVLVLFSPLAFAMGGSRSTKDIFSGYIRTFASMLLLLFSNVIFLKLVFSALGAMPSGVMVLPWALLVVGIARTARKADNLLGKIGMNPQFTGDPLGNGGGRFVAMMAARTAISSAMHSRNRYGGTQNGGNRTGTNHYNGGRNQSGGNYRTANANRNHTSAEQRQNSQNTATGTQNQSYAGAAVVTTSNNFSQKAGGGKQGSSNGTVYTGSNRNTSVSGFGITTKSTGSGGNRPADGGAVAPGKERTTNSADGKRAKGKSDPTRKSVLSGIRHNSDRNFKRFGRADTIHSNPDRPIRFGIGECPVYPETIEGENDGKVDR